MSRPDHRRNRRGTDRCAVDRQRRPLPGSASTSPAATLPGLTRRESAIAELLGKGLTNPAMAERLGLSAKTVANYVSIVLLKLGAENRLEAARIVRQWHETP
ncbi:MAG: hypothetical protein GEU74_15385 [Nitriliruptorales bacterium]|nr:hypothetical protein [Nitriliruptorales bacterium]